MFVADSSQNGNAGIGQAEHLEQRAHAAAAALDQAFQSACDVPGNVGRGLLHQGQCARLDAEPAQELALRDRPVDAGADGVVTDRADLAAATLR